MAADSPNTSVRPDDTDQIEVHIDHSLAHTERMDMSAPMEQIQAAPVQKTVAEQLAPPPLPALPSKPLRTDASPFKTMEPVLPAVEYVRLSPEVSVTAPAPRPAPPPVTPAIIAPPRSAPIMQPPAPVVPPVPKPRPIPVPAKRVVISPLPSVPAPQLTPPPQAPVAVPVTQTPPPTPMPAPQPAAAPAPLPASPVLQPQFAAAQSESLPLKDEAMYYSHNTQLVWRSRRYNRVLYAVAASAVLIMLVVVVAYWISLGSPTRIEDVPYLSDFLG